MTNILTLLLVIQVSICFGAEQAQWIEIATEAAGNAGTNKWRLLDFGSEIYSQYNNIEAYKLEWGANYAKKIVFELGNGNTDHIFENTYVNPNSKINILESNVAGLSVSSDQHFCKTCADGHSTKPGDTCWAILDKSDTQRQCGCNSGGWNGNGAYYGGYLPGQCNQCLCWGGAWAGYKTSGQQKGTISSTGLRLSIKAAKSGTKTFVSERKKFSEAREYCRVNYPNGNLASITSAGENEEVKSKCPNQGQLQSACWIGLTNPAISGNRWIDGKPITYTNWYDNGDGGASQPCSTIRSDGTWHTVGYCENGGGAALPFVCEEVTYIGDSLTVGQKIETGQGLRSSDGRFAAVMQLDGNFVVYKVNPSSGKIERYLWSTHGNAHVALSNGLEGRFMIYQNDNNFCMYDQNGGWKWCTMAHNNGQNIATNRVIMQSDSNLCVYNGHGWIWGTVQNGQPYANDVMPFSYNTMEVGLGVILLLVLINIFCVAYNFCYVRVKGKRTHLYGKVVSVESDTDI